MIVRNTKEPKAAGRQENVYNAQKEREQNRIGTKLHELRLSRGIQQKELSRMLEKHGVSVSAAAISKWEVGDAVPNPYQLYALCAALRYDRISDFFAETDYEGLSELNDEGQAKVREFIKILTASGLFSRQTERVRRPSPRSVSPLRVFDLPASAGTGAFVDSDAYEEIEFSSDDIPAGTDFGVRVYGKSMLPRYEDGQIAMVHRQKTLSAGDIGIFLVDNEAYIKKYTESEPLPAERDDYTAHDGTVYPKIVLVSLNPAYRNITVLPSQELTIIGKVLN